MMGADHEVYYLLHSVLALTIAPFVGYSELVNNLFVTIKVEPD